MAKTSTKKGPQVFLNFRGADLRNPFVISLHKALKTVGINAFMDSDTKRGKDLTDLFTEIEKSDIAVAIVSSGYTESEWCLDELVRIMECSRKEKGWKKLVVIPIFYQLEISVVRELDGVFGLNLLKLWRKKDDDKDYRIITWNEALQAARKKMAFIFNDETETGAARVARIVNTVRDTLTDIENSKLQEVGCEKEIIPEPLLSEGNSKSQKVGGEKEEELIPKPHKVSNRGSSITEARDERLRKLEEKLDLKCNDNETRIVAVVGMVGIGKTYLADKIYIELQKKYYSHVFIRFDSEQSNDQGLDWVQKRLVEGLLNVCCDDENAFQILKNQLKDTKVAIVFDNVTNREQIEPLLPGNCDWIKEGSRIVITTGDKSLPEGLEFSLYEVPGLNERDGLELFRTQLCTTLDGRFVEMSRKFVDFAGGNPLALKTLGEELKEKSEGHWEARLGTLSQVSNEEIRQVFRKHFENDLDDKQMDAFLDIVCFFRSEDESYVTSLLDSIDTNSAEAAGRDVIRDLVDKFMIHISDGRVEMHNLLFAVGKELVETTRGKYWVLSSNRAVSTDTLKNKEGRDQVRGVVIDMSKLEEMPLYNKAFVGMSSLRYLKVFDSLSNRHCEAQCKLNLPDELQFSEDNIIRYLDWMNFPGKELPSNFEPTHLIDLRLPFSKILSLWSVAKVAPNLKWLDLSHSSMLSSLSGLSKATNLLRINLEGCTSLENLPEEMKEMPSLVFLNLRGCTSLSSLPNITIDSLKTLILSGCSNLQTFKVISEHLETLYLNSTAIDRLPPAIGNLQRLIFLNLKDCKNLSTLPDSLGNLKSLQELKLSRCSKLKVFPDVKHMKEKLRVLLLDGTSIAEMPGSIFELSSLRRLSLGGNDNICSLQFDMGKMFSLKWLELKNCQNLISLPRLPPNLQSLNAHGCTSLRTVSSPLACPLVNEQIHSTFIFTNCYELDQVSKNAIVSYIQKKSELLSADRYNQDFVFKSLISTCFPGCEIPVWFNHQALGPIVKLELPQGWIAGKLVGIALCVVVSFKAYNDQDSSLQLNCTCEFTNTCLSPESFVVGGCSEPGDKSDHLFIGYTTLFNIKKSQQLPSATEATLRFEVTNGTRAVDGCKVMKCGFSFVYEADEAENTTWEETIRMLNNNQDQRSSFKTEDDVDRPTDQDSSDATPKADYTRLFRNWFVKREE